MSEHINDNHIRDYDIVLDAEFGEPGSPERAEAEEQAYVTYSELFAKVVTETDSK